MKLLVDACAGLRLARALRSTDHAVKFVGDWDQDPGDEEILKIAREQQRVVVTRDKDFGTLAVLQQRLHCGIVRLVELPPDREVLMCLSVLNQHAEDLQRSYLITVEAHRIRVRESGQN